LSTSPMLPEGPGSQLNSQLKSFWARPEGKVGMVFLAGIIGGGLLMFWASILPWLIGMVSDTLHLAYLVGILAAFLFVVTNPTIHARVALIFRLAMRFLTGLIINIDPIGILKDHINQMRKRKENLDEQISNVSGQIRVLKNTIARNQDEAAKSLRQAAEAQKLAGSATDDLQKQRMAVQVNLGARHAGRLKDTNIGYQQLLVKLTSVYEMLSKWAVNIDYFIEDTDDQVKQAEMTKKTVDSGFSALRSAMSIIKGNTDENEMYNTTLERLAEDADRKLGEIDDFQRVAQNFMDGIDVANGAAQQQSLDELNVYEQKMLTSGNPDMQFLKPGATQEKVPVAAKGVALPDDYQSMFQKK
jgi:predicted  nucleic acid-binding Zn-ribbon protein